MEKAKLIEEIIRLQHQVMRAVRPNAPEHWLGLNLTIGQLKSLFYINFQGSTNLKKLADALGVTPPNVTGIVDRLVEQGMVSRTENPEDRRIFDLTLTERGRALIASLRETGMSRMSAVLDELNSDELSALARGLGAFVREAERIVGEKDEHNR